MAPSVIPIDLIGQPETHEQEHVHQVYDKIAPHFSSTRYKPWPIVARFLESLPTGWIGLDSGTGNGKYLSLPLDRPGHIWTIGLDRSRNLLEIARNANAGGTNYIREVIWGDVLANSWRAGVFDYAISIATVHHLSTPERRQRAVRSLLQSLSPSHGRALIYVWAVQQDTLSKRFIPGPSNELHEGLEQKGRDVFVPWVSSHQQGSSSSSRTESKERHQQSEDQETICQIEDENAASQPMVYNRYYHMFDKGELGDLVCDAARDLDIAIGTPSTATFGRSATDPLETRRGIEIVQDGWEKSNFYIEVRLWEG